MTDRIAHIEAYPITIPREVPYLGPLESHLKLDEKGHFVRPGNQTVYSVSDHCVLVKVTTESGIVGWGECVAVVAPEIVSSILNELIIPLVRGRDPHQVVRIYEDLYNALRVRGFFGGFYHDAIAALDIALWDLRGKLLALPVCRLLGSVRHKRIPAYVSGLPCPTIEERTVMAKKWMDRGFSAVKFASAISRDGIIEEMKALRTALGPASKILVDMHWKFTAAEAIKLITELEKYDLYVAEAPVKPEDLQGQALVVRSVKTPVGIGEELRTVYEYLPRFEQRCMHVIQPEMGRTGLTAFWNICQMSTAFNCTVMPHASIGIGVFQAASLHASAALSNLAIHEYQHSVFNNNLQYIDTTMQCESGYFTVPIEPGLGVTPKISLLSNG